MEGPGRTIKVRKVVGFLKGVFQNPGKDYFILGEQKQRKAKIRLEEWKDGMYVCDFKGIKQMQREDLKYILNFICQECQKVGATKIYFNFENLKLNRIMLNLGAVLEKEHHVLFPDEPLYSMEVDKLKSI